MESAQCDELNLSPERYVAEFTINDLPKSVNQIGRSHWAVKVRERNKWRDLVRAAVGSYKPKQPLKRAHVVLIRYSSQPMDGDNLASSWKGVIDSLVDHGVLEDDSLKNIGMPEFKWERCEAKKGHVRIRVEEVESNE